MLTDRPQTLATARQGGRDPFLADLYRAAMLEAERILVTRDDLELDDMLQLELTLREIAEALVP